MKADVLDSEGYGTAVAGEAVYREVQALERDLDAVNHGVRNFTSIQDRVREEACIQQALANLRPR